MHAYCGGVGIALHLASVVILAYVLVSTTWTSATVVGTTHSVQLAFAPSQFCVDNACSTYASAYAPQLSPRQGSHMEQDVLDVFCGTMIPVSHKSNGIFDLFARAAGQNVCIAVMESCHALLVSMFTLAVISAGGATLCVTYWTHKHQIGRVLLAALVVSFVLHGAVVLLWTPYATPTFSPTTFSYGSVEVEMNAPFWTVVFNSCVVLTASMWFTYHLILDQRRRYLNRRHVHQLGKHPLDCPALYA